MQEKKQIKTISRKIKEFIDFRSKMSAEEKKMEAGILIEEMKSVDINEAYKKVNARIITRSKNAQIITWITRVAAVFTVPLLAFTVWSLFFQPKVQQQAENEVTMQEIQSPAGMRSHVVLPDGTNLWLNAESKIKYSLPFVRRNRQVELTGEAYFEVVKNKKVPFEVVADGAIVKVLGTHFNVKAYPEDKQLEVALTEGSVEFTGPVHDGKKATATLRPNDHLMLDKTTGKAQLENTNLDKYISWYKNTIIFDDTPMREVAETLERWYGVKVVIADKGIYKYRITTTFENEPLFRVLELLELSSPSIKITYTPGKINKQTHLASQSIVRITKK